MIQVYSSSDSSDTEDEFTLSCANSDNQGSKYFFFKITLKQNCEDYFTLMFKGPDSLC